MTLLFLRRLIIADILDLLFSRIQLLELAVLEQDVALDKVDKRLDAPSSVLVCRHTKHLIQFF